MYLPFSGQSPLLRVLANSSTKTLCSSIVDTLEEAGWVKSIAGIYTSLACTSPQGFTSRVKIWEGKWIQVDQIYLQFGNTNQGRIWAISNWNQSLTYQIHANKCQFFISRPQVEADIYGSVVCGGVPFLPPTYNTEECWWSSGDWIGNPFAYGLTPRRALLNKSFKYTGQVNDYPKGDGFYAGFYSTTPTLIETLTSAGEIDYTTFTTLANATLLDSTEMHYPALAVWGIDNTLLSKVRGVLWDALVSSGPNVMDTIRVFNRIPGDDEIMTFNGSRWINFTNDYYFGSLWLLMPYPSGNYTY